jgi:hypothetical protein
MRKTIYNKVVGIRIPSQYFFHMWYMPKTNVTRALIYSYLHGWEYSIKAGLSIGGTSPYPT